MSWKRVQTRGPSGTLGNGIRVLTRGAGDTGLTDVHLKWFTGAGRPELGWKGHRRTLCLPRVLHGKALGLGRRKAEAVWCQEAYPFGFALASSSHSDAGSTVSARPRTPLSSSSRSDPSPRPGKHARWSRGCRSLLRKCRVFTSTRCGSLGGAPRVNPPFLPFPGLLCQRIHLEPPRGRREDRAATGTDAGAGRPRGQAGRGGWPLALLRRSVSKRFKLSESCSDQS